MKQVYGGGDEPESTLDEGVTALGQVHEQAGALDDILDEIDVVLANDAQAFVQDFVQKGGQ